MVLAKADTDSVKNNDNANANRCYLPHILYTPLSKIIIKYNIQPIFNLYITIVMYLTYNINEKKSIINKNL